MMNPIYTEAVRNQASWARAGADEQELDCVQVVGREPVTAADKVAHGVVKTLRYVRSSYTPIPSFSSTTDA